MKTAYDELGVSLDAADDAIRTAYLNAARAYHPDLNSGDSAAAEHFKRINAAHNILKHPSQRATYDQYLLRRYRRMQRARTVAIASYAGACLIGVALATGHAYFLRQWSSTDPSPAMPLDDPLVGARSPPEPTARAIVRDEDARGRGQEGHDDTITGLAPDASARAFDATADARDGLSGPAEVPEADGTTVRDPKATETRDPAMGHSDEKAKGDGSQHGVMTASHAVEASTFRTRHSPDATATYHRRVTAEGRRMIPHDRKQPQAWFSHGAPHDGGARPPHVTTAQHLYQVGYMEPRCRWGARARIIWDWSPGPEAMP